jgi:hypothetical protein
MSTLNFSKLRLDCERCQLCDPRYRDGRCIEDWKLTHQAIHDENELIGQRVNWLSLAQAIFGLALGSNAFRILPDSNAAPRDLCTLISLSVAFIALWYSLIVYTTIRAAEIHIGNLMHWWRVRYNQTESANVTDDEKVKEWITLPYPPISGCGLFNGTKYSYINAKSVPLMFAFIWANIFVGILIWRIAPLSPLIFIWLASLVIISTVFSFCFNHVGSLLRDVFNAMVLGVKRTWSRVRSFLRKDRVVPADKSPKPSVLKTALKMRCKTARWASDSNGAKTNDLPGQAILANDGNREAPRPSGETTRSRGLLILDNRS